MACSQDAAERWRPVPGYEGCYEVSDLGKVRSIDRDVAEKSGKVKTLSGKILSQGIGTTGYYLVSLCRDGRCRTKKVHNLVLTTFVGVKPEGMICCHGPGGPLDNRLTNLGWGTPKRNASTDRLRDGTLGRRLTAEQAAEVNRDPRTHAEIAMSCGVAESTVRDIKSGRNWGSLGLPQDLRQKQQGENHGSAKLTEAEVLSIRGDPRDYPSISLAYGISLSNVYAIKQRRSWRHLS